MYLKKNAKACKENVCHYLIFKTLCLRTVFVVFISV